MTTLITAVLPGAVLAFAVGYARRYGVNRYMLTATLCLVAGLALLMADHPALAFCGFVAAAFPLVGYAVNRGGQG